MSGNVGNETFDKVNLEMNYSSISGLYRAQSIRDAALLSNQINDHSDRELAREKFTREFPNEQMTQGIIPQHELDIALAEFCDSYSKSVTFGRN